MDLSQLNASFLTTTAISALKKAYEECSDKAAQESIITAFKAVIELHLDLCRHGARDEVVDDGDFDPSEYCAAV